VPVGLDEVQSLTDIYSHGTVRLHDPVWMTNFRLHHRAAALYRAGPVFLTGDAAHVHSLCRRRLRTRIKMPAVPLPHSVIHSIT
jgi:hypothetical protein